MLNSSDSIFAWFVERKYNFTKYFNLLEQNERLAEENAILRSKLDENFYQLGTSISNVDDSTYEQEYRYISAQVMNSTSTHRDNFLIINKGGLSGINVGMGVRDCNGIIGFVYDVKPHRALIKTILSENINIPVKLKKNDEFWLLKWDGYDNEIAQVTGVNRDVDITMGDTIVTRGGNGMFPIGVPVGTVKDIISEDGKQTLVINILLAANFSGLHHVEVIQNLFQEEQNDLEAKVHGFLK